MYSPLDPHLLMDVHSLIDEYVPVIVDLLWRPHLAEAGAAGLRGKLREEFDLYEFKGDEADCVFDVLLAVAEREVFGV